MDTSLEFCKPTGHWEEVQLKGQSSGAQASFVGEGSGNYHHNHDNHIC